MIVMEKIGMRLPKAAVDTIIFVCNFEHPDMYINGTNVFKFWVKFKEEGGYK